MTDVFLERLHASAIEIEPETAARWKKAIGSHVEDVSDEALADLVRAAFKRTPDTEAAAALRSACLDADGNPAVPPDAGFLTALLACEALIDLFDRRVGSIKVRAALLVSAAGANHWEAAHPDVCAEGEAAIAAAAIRTFTPLKPPRAAGQAASTKEALEGLANADWGFYRTAITELANEITRLRTYSTRLSTYVNEVQKPVLEQQELSWWIISRRCMSLDRPFADLPASAAACLAALDLWKLAPRSPGPFAAPSLMAYVLKAATDNSQEEMSALRDAIGQLRELGVEQLFPSPNEAIGDFLPVLTAIDSGALQGGDEVMSLRALSERTHTELRLASYDD